MNEIVRIARSYIGQMEVGSNRGFKDPVFEKKMRSAGFYTGAPWCAIFAELCYREAGDDTHKLITPSAVLTMKAASTAGNWHLDAVPGAIAIWRTFHKGQPLSTGHVAIVTTVGAGGFGTVEGNTNAVGGREGNTVAEKERSYSWDRTDGLRLMGFVHPK